METTQDTEQTRPQIALNDLAIAIQVIDVASRRGAFEGAELAAIGALRTRFDAIIKAYAPPAASPAAVTPTV